MTGYQGRNLRELFEEHFTVAWMAKASSLNGESLK